MMIKGKMITLITLTPEQRAVLLKNGKIEKVVSEGKIYAFFKTVEVFNIFDQVKFNSIKNEYALLCPNLKKEVEVYEIKDYQIGILFQESMYRGVLQPGKYVYWKSKVNRQIIKLDLRNPYIPDSIDMITVMNPDLKEYIVSYAVEPYQKGLLFIDNKLEKILEPGNHFYLKGEKSVSIYKVDLRQQQIEVLGQEIMTREKIPLRINFYCQYKIEDVTKIYLHVRDYEKQFYLLIQMILREYIGTLLLDEMLEKKIEVEKYINEKIALKGEGIGLTVISSGIKDVILPGEIREIMNRVLIAEKRAQANVITRREEIASTRSLLNTAKLLDENKTLYHLKELEYIERISEKISQLSISGGSTQLLEELKKIFIPRSS
jgi:regulator of protease activity HflC (stomatin/prohibitin superfamily)